MDGLCKYAARDLCGTVYGISVYVFKLCITHDE